MGQTKKQKNLYMKRFYRANRERILAYQEGYYKNNRKECLLRAKKYREAHREKALLYAHQYYKDHPEKFIIKDPTAKRAWRRERQKQRKLQDHIYRLRTNISTSIAKRVARYSKNKVGESKIARLPYTIRDLAQRLEGLFLPGMSWDNYGKWHVDHIIPHSSFDYKSIYDASFQRCWALKNLQPMWAPDNIKKGAKLIICP